MAGEGEDAPRMNGSEDTVVMSQLRRAGAKDTGLEMQMTLKPRRREKFSSFEMIFL